MEPDGNLPRMMEWYDKCESYGLLLSPLNTEDLVEDTSNLIAETHDMDDSRNEWWQVGLKIDNGNCTWSNGEAYVPEKHDQLFHEDFRPNCQLDGSVAYLKVLERRLYSFADDKHVNKLCSGFLPFPAEDKTESYSLFFSMLVVVILLMILMNIYFIVSSRWYQRMLEFIYPPAFPRPTRTSEVSNPTENEAELNSEHKLQDESIEMPEALKLSTES